MPHFSSKASSACWAASASSGGVDRFEVAGDLLALAPRDVFEAVADQVHDARLHDGLGEDRLDRLREALQAVDAADQDVCDAALLELGEDLHPELRALGLLKPHAEHVALALDRDPEREVARAALDDAAFADLDHQRVEKEHRVDVVERSLLPGADVVDDRVGDAADQVAADLDAVDLLEVRLDVARRQPARVERQDLVVEALKAALALAHDLRLEAALAVSRGLDRHRPVLGRKRLRRRPVARVPAPAGRLLMALIAQVLGQLGRHRALHQPAREIGQQAARPDDLLLGPGAGEQLVDQLVAEPITNLGRQPGQRRAQRPARRASVCSGSRGGCPPRLPQNRACAVRTRLLGTAGCEPRRQPVLDLDYSQLSTIWVWAGAMMSLRQSRCSSTRRVRPRCVKYRTGMALSTAGLWLRAHVDLRPS